MKQELIADLQYQFNLIAHNIDAENVEFWYARDLQIILGYDKWENFFRVIEKAKISKGIKGTGYFIYLYIQKIYCSILIKHLSPLLIIKNTQSQNLIQRKMIISINRR